MENNLHDILRQPQKQSPVAIFAFVLRFLKMLIRSTWVIILLYFIGNKDEENNYTNLIISIVGLAVAAVALVMSVLSYFRYTYFINNDSLNIHKGVLGRKKINIPFERIQNINFKQKILHRICNVVSLEIDTAGSTGSEIKIEALSKKQANLIRDYILEKKKFIQVENIGNESEIEKEIPPIKSDKLLLHLNIIDLIKIGVSQNHLRTAGLIIGFGFTFFDNIQEALGFDSVQYAIDNIGFIGTSTFSRITVPLIILLAISFLITLIRTFFQYFDLRFFKTDDGYRLKMGLLTKQEVSLREEKIQIISWAKNPIRKLFKIFTLTIKQAAAGIVVNKKQAANIPGCYQYQVDEVINSCFNNYKEQEFSEYKISPAYFWRRSIYFGLIPLLIVGVPYLIFPDSFILLFPLLLPLFAIPLIFIFYKKFRLFISPEYLRIKKGTFATRYTVLPIYKIQSVEIIQTIYQRRKGLANIKIYTAGGSISVPYFDEKKAKKLRNYILYKVEISNRAWM